MPRTDADDIRTFFEEWGYSDTHLDGFANWLIPSGDDEVFDILSDLRHEDDGALAGDISAAFRESRPNVDPQDSSGATREYLDSYRRELIGRLEDYLGIKSSRRAKGRPPMASEFKTLQREYGFEPPSGTKGKHKGMGVSEYSTEAWTTEPSSDSPLWDDVLFISVDPEAREPWRVEKPRGGESFRDFDRLTDYLDGLTKSARCASCGSLLTESGR